MDNKFWKYEVENIKWGYVIDEHGKAITFLSLEENGRLHNMAVALHGCFVIGSTRCKGVTA